MKFQDVEEIQTLLDKTSTTADRLKTSLWLLNSQVTALKELFQPFREMPSDPKVQDYKKN